MDAANLKTMLMNVCIPCDTERRMQDAVEAVLKTNGVQYAREHRLSDEDIVDFMVEESIAVECKVAGSLDEVARQLQRYDCHAQVQRLMLVTRRREHMRFIVCQDLTQKPLTVILVGGDL